MVNLAYFKCPIEITLEAHVDFSDMPESYVDFSVKFFRN